MKLLEQQRPKILVELPATEPCVPPPIVRPVLLSQCAEVGDGTVRGVARVAGQSELSLQLARERHHVRVPTVVLPCRHQLSSFFDDRITLIRGFHSILVDVR